jgi:hypothetical protein
VKRDLATWAAFLGVLGEIGSNKEEGGASCDLGDLCDWPPPLCVVKIKNKINT